MPDADTVMIDHRPSAKCCHGDSTQCPWPPQGLSEDIRFV